MISCKKIYDGLYIFKHREGYKKFAIEVCSDLCNRHIDEVKSVVFPSHYEEDDDRSKDARDEYYSERHKLREQLLNAKIDKLIKKYNLEEPAEDESYEQKEKMIFEHEFINNIGMEMADDESYFHGNFFINKAKIEAIIPLLDSFPQRWISVKF